MLSRGLRGVPLGDLMCRRWPISFSKQMISLGSNLLTRTGSLPLPFGMRRSNLDMLNNIIISELNARIQRLSRSGLTA
jgi:hypothetical protein